MLTRKEIEDKEEKFLAPYAAKSAASRGRQHKETEHAYRTAYQRDHDRIVHTSAFRRLEYKTQVFVNHEGDHYRTRLTHTLEVAQIACSLARALRLNIDLAEAISFAHDLGHTPFGHSGEEALHELMKTHGGFEHNRHGLRVVDYLEERYPNFPGLNLTYEVREGIIKHSTAYDCARVKEFSPQELPTLEAQVVDLADEIAYDNHDVDDGLYSGLLSEDDLEEIELWREVKSKVMRAYPKINPEICRYQVIRNLINLQVSDAIAYSEKQLAHLNIDSLKKVRQAKAKLISLSPPIRRKREQLRKFLAEKLYQNYRVVRMADKAKRFIRALFEVYLAKPTQLPPSSQKRLKAESTHRIICDYIAGMTDRYALDEYKKLFQPYERV
jgi:dGTPase